MIRLRTWAGLALAGLVLLAGAAQAAAPKFPALSGRVVDEAHILSAPVVADLTTRLEALETKTSRQLVVVTVPDLQGYEIEEYGYQLGRAWGIGQKGVNNGLIFLVAPTERKVRIEVGYGLEGVVTDALSSVILQTQVLPKFKAGDMPGGVVAGTNALIDQLSADPSTAEQRIAQAAASRQTAQTSGESGGGIAVFVVFIVVVLVLRSLMGGRPGRGGGLWWLLPIILSGGGGGRGGGGRGGGWGDGGGFGGGGGSFGGGGSSGSW